MLRLHFGADLFGLFQDAQGVLAENFPDVALGIAFAQQGFGDFRQLGGVFHAFGHVRAVEIGAEADVVGADEFHGVIDVIDDSFPADVRKLAFGDELVFRSSSFRGRCILRRRRSFS